MFTVFIVDDHEMILPGIRMTIESLEGFKVIGQATDGLSGFNSIMELRPDIAILDLSVPVLNGFGIARKLHEKKNPAKIILLTSFSEDSYIKQAMELKIDGYVLKENSGAELIQALKAVSSGYRYLAPKVMTRVMDGLVTVGSQEAVGGFDSLTSRERDVLALISEGRRGKEICSILGVSESTLKTHKASLMRKLDVGSTNELIVLVGRNHDFKERLGSA
jgi:DNA-binding NarL/FixJ family response regulator